MSAEPTMSSRHDNGSALVADVPTGLFIDGKWRPASDGETFEVIDPATGQPLTSVASAAVDDGRDAAAAAAAAARSGPPPHRENVPRSAPGVRAERPTEKISWPSSWCSRTARH
jgi:succinate-semialdehyde dehydrogenase/glutarate-semialdehyde dehydrogenase